MAEIGAHVIKERLNKWAFLFLFSVLCLTAHETDDENKNTYVTVCTAVSIALSFLASVLHLGTTSLSAFFVSTVIEGLSSLILVALWGGALPIIMDPTNGLAQMYVGKDDESKVHDYQSTISNANLYFTSWGAGVCAVMILASYIRERLGGVGAGMGYTSNWYLLMLASVIVIIESMRFKNQVCSLEDGTEAVTCGRNTYGLVTGESICDPRRRKVMTFPKFCSFSYTHRDDLPNYFFQAASVWACHSWSPSFHLSEKTPPSSLPFSDSSWQSFTHCAPGL